MRRTTGRSWVCGKGAWLVVDDATVILEGSSGARLFRRGQPPMEYASGSRLDFLMRDVERVPTSLNSQGASLTETSELRVET